MSTIKVNKIQPTAESGVLDIIGFRFLNLLLGNVVYSRHSERYTTYREMDVVIYGDLIYRCNTVHDSLNTFEESYWDLLDVSISVGGVTPGQYVKVTVDAFGRVVAGSTMEPSDIPNIDASKLTSGLISTNRLGTGSADSGNFLRGDSSWGAPRITKIRETLIASQGQTVFTSSTLTYSVGLGTLDVYVNGILQILGDSYVETSENTITFSEGLTEGMKVMLVESRIV